MLNGSVFRERCWHWTQQRLLGAVVSLKIGVYVYQPHVYYYCCSLRMDCPELWPCCVHTINLGVGEYLCISCDLSRGRSCCTGIIGIDCLEVGRLGVVVANKVSCDDANRSATAGGVTGVCTAYTHGVQKRRRTMSVVGSTYQPQSPTTAHDDPSRSANEGDMSPAAPPLRETQGSFERNQN